MIYNNMFIGFCILQLQNDKTSIRWQEKHEVISEGWGGKTSRRWQEEAQTSTQTETRVLLKKKMAEGQLQKDKTSIRSQEKHEVVRWSSRFQEDAQISTQTETRVLLLYYKRKLAEGQLNKIQDKHTMTRQHWVDKWNQERKWSVSQGGIKYRNLALTHQG